jgi:GT2 family glycosyltransferase
MSRAKGNYFIILDSDCILPPSYIETVHRALLEQYVDCYGGPDTALESFSNIQKAINYVMTSFLTTGGIRGGKKQVQNFQPRSFNMGLSNKAFEASNGYGDIHPGEDPDLVLRLWSLGFKTRLVPEAYVYHKRRISWSKFYTQVHKFGLVRPILTKWHSGSGRIAYWFPTIFVVGAMASVVFALLGLKVFLVLFLLYCGIIFVHSSAVNKNLSVGLLSVFAMLIQFYGYGTGFLKSTIAVSWLGKLPRKRFPKLFFK